MNNYTYIIASIPHLEPGSRAFEGGSVMPMIDWIESQLGEADRKKCSFVRKGFTPSELNEDFYIQAFKARDGFTREFFAMDLALRNAKVEYLNKSLDRAPGTDVIKLENAPQTGSSAAIARIFDGDNLLEREKAIDDFLWKAADEITLMKNFQLANILAIVAKLCIIERWLALDEEKGRELLSQLVSGIRGTYGTIKFEQFK